MLPLENVRGNESIIGRKTTDIRSRQLKMIAVVTVVMFLACAHAFAQFSPSVSSPAHSGVRACSPACVRAACVCVSVCL